MLTLLENDDIFPFPRLLQTYLPETLVTLDFLLEPDGSFGTLWRAYGLPHRRGANFSVFCPLCARRVSCLS
jgi:hypothetical protein